MVDGIVHIKTRYTLSSGALRPHPVKKDFFTHFLQLPVVGVIFLSTILSFIKRVFFHSVS